MCLIWNQSRSHKSPHQLSTTALSLARSERAGVAPPITDSSQPQTTWGTELLAEDPYDEKVFFDKIQI